MDIKLFKKTVKYKDSAGEEKTGVNVYLRCGTSSLIPIQVRYFEDKETHKDPRYMTRKQIVESYAEVLPDNEQ